MPGPVWAPQAASRIMSLEKKPAKGGIPTSASEPTHINP